MQLTRWFGFSAALASLVAATGCTSGDETSVTTGYIDSETGEACTPDPETFRHKGNNGHGNNLDGIDISNPGNGPKNQPGVDPSEPIDDEKKGWNGGGGDQDDPAPGCDAFGCCEDDDGDDDDDDSNGDDPGDDEDDDGSDDDDEDCPDDHDDDDGEDPNAPDGGGNYDDPPVEEAPDPGPLL